MHCVCRQLFSWSPVLADHAAHRHTDTRPYQTCATCMPDIIKCPCACELHDLQALRTKTRPALQAAQSMSVHGIHSTAANDGACLRQLLPKEAGKHMHSQDLQLQGHLP